MKSTIGLAAGLLLAGLTLHCSGTPTMGTTDLLTAPADQATAVVDMQAAGDFATAPADMNAGFNKCTTFMDQSAQTASRDITFPAGGLTYSPRCILINKNQSVTFKGAGDFAAHPLRPGVGSDATAGSPQNPIPVKTTGTTDLVVPFPAAGDYPYNCSRHDGSGMNGTVRVQ